jgi:hypothetical protein
MLLLLEMGVKAKRLGNIATTIKHSISNVFLVDSLKEVMILLHLKVY